LHAAARKALRAVRVVSAIAAVDSALAVEAHAALVSDLPALRSCLADRYAGTRVSTGSANSIGPGVRSLKQQHGARHFDVPLQRQAHAPILARDVVVVRHVDALDAQCRPRTSRRVESLGPADRSFSDGPPDVKIEIRE
jgi:hypothetical protein